MAEFGSHMGDPRGDQQTVRPAHNTPIHMDWVPFLKKPYKKSMWIGAMWAGPRVAMWIPHVGGKFCHGLLEESLIIETRNDYLHDF